MTTARTRDKAEGDRDTVSRDAAGGNVTESANARSQDIGGPGAFPDTSAPPPHDETEADIHELPRNEKPRHGAIGGPSADPRGGETGTQDLAPTADDIRLEATLEGHRAGEPGVDEWMSAQRRFEPGLESSVEDARSGDEDLAVRGPERSTGKGRVVTDGETVADDAADADATRDRTAGRNTDDAGDKG